jgi:uncharacterized membrane protein YraQ (UPF0718 family)
MMEYAKSKSSTVKFNLIVIVATAAIVFGFQVSRNKLFVEQAASMVTLALSIILQALPFILIGVLFSSLIRFLLREEWIAKIAPRNRIAGVIVGSLLGLFFPVCDCGVMPVARSLLRKGVSMSTACAYLLTAPVINPVVILATALAFQWNWHIALWRVGGTFVVGGITALLVGCFFTPRDFGVPAGRFAEKDLHSEAFNIRELLAHTAEEFFDIGRYLIVSAFLASMIQIWVPKDLFFQYVGTPYLAIAAMMILAIAMSLCSEADAFVARALANQFPLGAVFAFLIIGQILDLRNLILFGKNFRPALFIVIAVVSLALTFVWAFSIDFGFLHFI